MSLIEKILVYVAMMGVGFTLLAAAFVRDCRKAKGDKND